MKEANDHNHRNRWIWWLVVAAIVVVTTFLIMSPAVKEQLDTAIAWAEVLMADNPFFGAVVFTMLAMLSATLTFTSSALLVPPANLAWGRTITFILLWGGYLLGAVLAYSIGRLARPLVHKLGYEKKIAEYETFANTHMTFWSVLLVCIAAQSEVSGYLFGGLRLAFVKYMSAVFIVEAFYAWIFVVGGESLLRSNPITLLAMIAFFVVTVAAAGWLLRRQKKRHDAEKT